MSTVQQIIDRGFAKSAAARPETMTATTELVDRIGQCLRELFQVLARENPYILGTSAQATFNGTGWSRPVDCLRAIQVRADNGTIATPAIAPATMLSVVPFDDQAFALGTPSLTELGQQYIPTGQLIDPSAGTLTIIYARAPIQPTTVADSIDPLFPAMFDDFLQFDVAAYLATKDKRQEDEQTFLGMKSNILQQIIDWSRGQTYGIQQRFALVTAPTTNTGGGRQQPNKAG